MTDSENILTDTFSRLLLHYKDFDHFNHKSTNAKLAHIGHGPFCAKEDSTTIYDLRLNEFRWAFGHSHPLLLKSSLIATSNSLPCRTPIKENISSLNSKIKVESEYNFHAICSDLLQITIELLNEFKISMDKVIIVDENLLISEGLESIIKKINYIKNDYILVEKNLLTYHYNGTPVYNLLDKKPLVYVNNWGLTAYSIYSNSEIPIYLENNLSSQVIHSNFLKLLRESNVLNQNGAIFNKNKLLQKFAKDLNYEHQLLGTCLVINHHCDIDQLRENGLLCTINNGKLIINFPLTIKENQIAQVFAILMEHI